MADFISSVQVLPSFTDVIANSGLNSNIPILINLATVTTPVTDFGPVMYTGAGSSGVGNAQAGTSSRESGFTIYPKNTGFEAKVTNLSSASNDIKVTLEFAEIPSSVATS